MPTNFMLQYSSQSSSTEKNCNFLSTDHQNFEKEHLRDSQLFLRAYRLPIGRQLPIGLSFISANTTVEISLLIDRCNIFCDLPGRRNKPSNTNIDQLKCNRRDLRNPSTANAVCDWLAKENNFGSIPPAT